MARQVSRKIKRERPFFPRRPSQSRVLSRAANLATPPNRQLTRRLGILIFVQIVATVTVI